MSVLRSFRHLAVLASCSVSSVVIAQPPAQPPLKDAAHGLFRVGAALNNRQFAEQSAAAVSIVERHFDSITPENVMKWERIHPQPERFAFDHADQFVEFGRKRGMHIVGHTLMWHSQTPKWVFEDKAGRRISREALLQRLREHIHTVVGRYRGKVHGWDVVNEAIRDEDGTLRTDKPWYAILGEEGVFEAFKAAHEADPEAELYYNDYSLDNPKKRAGVIKLAQAIRARGLRIDGIGSQEHCLLDHPTIEAIDATYNDIRAAGFKAMVTELDVSVLPRPSRYSGAEISKAFKNTPELDPYRKGLPAEIQSRLAERYNEIFGVFAKHHDTITRVTFWGVSDADSWLNNWPIRGRTDYALLFDRQDQPKPALDAAVDALKSVRR